MTDGGAENPRVVRTISTIKCITEFRSIIKILSEIGLDFLGILKYDASDILEHNGYHAKYEIHFENQTFEQPGVKAPGTANRTPFLLPKTSAKVTLFVGEPSKSGVVGSLSPAWKQISGRIYCTSLPLIYYQNIWTTPKIRVKITL